jgi:hypothetical protein
VTLYIVDADLLGEDGASDTSECVIKIKFKVDGEATWGAWQDFYAQGELSSGDTVTGTYTLTTFPTNVGFQKDSLTAYGNQQVGYYKFTINELTAFEASFSDLRDNPYSDTIYWLDGTSN